MGLMDPKDEEAPVGASDSRKTSKPRSGKKSKRSAPHNTVDMSHTLIHHPIFLCLSCLIGFCLVVTVLLVPLPDHDDAGYLKELVLVTTSKLKQLHLAKNINTNIQNAYSHRAGEDVDLDIDIQKKDDAEMRQLEHEQDQEVLQQEQQADNPHVLQPHIVVGAAAAAASGSSTDGIPYLPPFAPIPNGAQYKQETLAGKPSVAGIATILNDFLSALHKANKHNSEIKADLPELIQTYFELAQEYLEPFDAKYRQQPIFPIRDDDSIFISLAAFREHLLGQTLRSAFEQAEFPEKIHVGVIVQNCFGLDGYQCRTGMQVYGKDEVTGKDKAKISDAPPDTNGIEEFCTDVNFQKYCDQGQVRVIYQHETDALGPAVARYYASKLWAGETYFMQMDAHLEFAPHWDTFYINEVQLAKAYPKAVLSTYPPGFQQFGTYAGGTKGHRLCHCEFSSNGVERHIIRINANGAYNGDEPRPTQIAYIAAGFFFARAEFLVDVPFDPYLPWCFMGEEIALSMRAWTAGWDIYAPRTNMIAHQYRPGRLGLPKFWEAVGRDSHRPQLNTRLQAHILRRVKFMVGYPDDTQEIIEAEGDGLSLTEFQHYSLGTVRTREAYLNLTQIDPVEQKCHYLKWCARGLLE